MKPFMDEDFLLSTPTAQKLYHDYAEKMPIIDYHCHVVPEEIANDRRYENVAQLFLGGNGYGDHYKWRLMRACGVSERLITGAGDDAQRFRAFAEMLPSAIGNPVYHWTHLELKRYFGIDTPLNGDTSDEIWNECNRQLAGGLTVRELIRRSGVYAIATTDDPADSLQWHAAIAADTSFDTKVLPAWRPDRLMNITAPTFAEYIEGLGGASDLASLKALILKRMDHFDAHGCRASDHGLAGLEYVPATDAELDVIYKKALSGGDVTPRDDMAFRFAMMRFLGGEYARRGWVMEIHYGAIRNINSVMLDKLGADTGYDAIGTSIQAGGLPILLDTLLCDGALPRTILFSLDPSDNAMLTTICKGFQQEGHRGWVQQGAAWWFNDTQVGMREQLTRFSSLAPLGVFLGMVTDSRSFSAYTRHEYFRRILCDMIGEWVENGEHPNDMERLGKLVQDICFNNTKEYFGL